MGNIFWISPFAAPINTNLTRVEDSTWAHPGGIFFLTNYLQVQTPIESYASYPNLLLELASLFAFLYALIIHLVVIGYSKDKIFTTWTLLLLLGSLGCLILPLLPHSCGQDGYCCQFFPSPSTQPTDSGKSPKTNKLNSDSQRPPEKSSSH
jgi:hypothetical protein